MKKELYNNISNIIGYTNLIIVTIIFILIIINPQKISYRLADFLGHYLIYSFIPALISIIMAVLVNREYRGFNLIANVIFLILYALVFIFSKFMSMYG